MGPQPFVHGRAVPGRPLVLPVSNKVLEREAGNHCGCEMPSLFSEDTGKEALLPPLLGQALTLGSPLLFFLLSNFHCPLYPWGSPLELQRPCKCPRFFFAASWRACPSPCLADPSFGATWPA